MKLAYQEALSCRFEQKHVGVQYTMSIKETFWKNSSLTPVYALEPFPSTVTKTIFLAGPTPRNGGAKSWREDALTLLAELGYDGHVFIPEASDGVWKNDYDGQVEWEEEGLNRADVILFWVPRDLTGNTYGTPMPALTTNDEWGFWKKSGKIVWSSPSWADKTSYQRYYAKKYGIPVGSSLKEGLELSLGLINGGAERTGGECQIPLHVWRKKEFQSWLTYQKLAGNILNGGRVLWGYFPKPGFMFCYAVKVDVHVTSENRNKTNEVFFARPDISSVVLYSPSNDDIDIVLIREFRSTVRNNESFVYELPSGSSVSEIDNVLGVAASEVFEETGLKLNHNRFKRLETRQLLSTVSIHTASLFACELTREEIDQLKADSAPHGNHITDSEMTFIEVRTVSEILESKTIDWTTLGLIFSALHQVLPE